MSIRVSEKFFSIQGENSRIGNLSIWIRLFGCNLKCPGFFQPDPTNTETYLPSYQNIDINTIKHINDLPVVQHGCDSFYSWHKNFRHLATTYETADDLMRDIIPMLYDGKWQHPVTGNYIDLDITGGESLMQQKNVIEIIEAANKISGGPKCVSIETNGTIPLTEEFISKFRSRTDSFDNLLNFNISPKLYHVSGEKDAFKYDTIIQYQDICDDGVLKIVINNDDRAWDELNEHVKNLKDLGLHLPIFIMPVGATYEQQTDSSILSNIADRAIKEGYHISGRLHAVLWGNTMGT